MGVGTSLILIAVGAILDFAVKVSSTNFNVNTIGVILMVIGGVGLLISLIFWNSWGGFGRGGRVDREQRVVRDGAGGTYVEEHNRF
jgi:sulfite exporter TauE/SafE